MTPEYLLDAVGLLDDDLILEAESCAAPRRQSTYRSWMTLAASVAVVIALGYALTHIGGMGGGAAPEFSGGAAGAGNSENQATDGPWGQDSSTGESIDPSSPEPGDSVDSPLQGADPGEPNAPGRGPEAERIFAVLADGTVYQATEEYVLPEPAENAVQYTISGGAEEDDNFLPAGTAYVMLEPGVAAVRVEETGPWQIFISVEP